MRSFRAFSLLYHSFGSFGIQPSEFAKSATALAIAKYLSDVQINLKDVNRQIQALGILFLPVLLILPHDPGSALIYSVFLFVFYREGLPAWYLWTAFITIVLFAMTLVFEPHYVVLVAFATILLQYFKSRAAHRNPVL